MKAAPPALTERFLAAVALAQEVHGSQRRTGTKIPYLAHLLVVTGLVIEDGGDEDQAIAAMLHDSVEDGGGRPMLERIGKEFGRGVAAIVEGCSDSMDGDPMEPRIERKRRYLAHLPAVEDDAILRVALADKVNNARSIVRYDREEGQALWARFPERTVREQLWYYSGLVKFFDQRRPGPLAEDLWRPVGELAWLVARDQAQQSEQLRLWLDPDLHDGQAAEGWVQLRTRDEAIELLQALPVLALSLYDAPEAHQLVHWLIDHAESRGHDLWPTEEISFHGPATPAAWRQLQGAIAYHAELRGGSDPILDAQRGR
jgi:HD domain